MAVDGAVLDVDLIIVGSIHQRVSALENTRTQRESLQNQKLSDRKQDGFIFPCACVTFRVHSEAPVLQRLGAPWLFWNELVAAQHSLDPLQQKPTRERFSNEIIRAHL